MLRMEAVKIALAVMAEVSLTKAPGGKGRGLNDRFGGIAGGIP